MYSYKPYSHAVISYMVRSCSTSAQALHRRKVIDRIIRVDHAGELGADRIYAGQMAVLG